MSHLKGVMATLHDRFELTPIGEAGGIDVMVHAMQYKMNQPNADPAQLLPWMRFLRECVHTVHWARVVASVGTARHLHVLARTCTYLTV